jgi:predicted permease
LLCIGAALDFHAARQWIVPVVSSSVMKFVVMPVMTLLIALSAGLTGASLMTALVFQMLPTATSSYIMARQLGGDAPLMAGITAAQTVLALAAIPSVLLGISMWVTL